MKNVLSYIPLRTPFFLSPLTLRPPQHPRHLLFPRPRGFTSSQQSAQSAAFHSHRRLGGAPADQSAHRRAEAHRGRVADSSAELASPRETPALPHPCAVAAVIGLFAELAAFGARFALGARLAAQTDGETGETGEAGSGGACGEGAGEAGETGETGEERSC